MKIRHVKEYFYGIVNKKGKLIFEDVGAFFRKIASLTGKQVEITISVKRNKRTAHQNNYYWGVVLDEISRKTGETKDDMHQALKAHLLSNFNEEWNIWIPKSTAKLDTKEFTKYVESVKEWAHSYLNLTIPEANEFVEDDEDEIY